MTVRRVVVTACGGGESKDACGEQEPRHDRLRSAVHVHPPGAPGLGCRPATVWPTVGQGLSTGGTTVGDHEGRHVAGRDGEEAIWQPEWSPAGELVLPKLDEER